MGRTQKMRIVGEEISKYYRNGRVAAKGLDGASIALGEGDFALLVGASGSGKSTLAKILSLQISCDEGDIYFDGKKEFYLDEKEKQRLKTFDLAYISPNDSLIESLSPLDNLLAQAAGAFDSKRKLRKAAKEALISLGLGKVMHRKASLLSGGERDRTVIALSLILPSSVFFFDEPLSDLNPAMKELCLHKILEKTEGKTVLFITHDSSFVERYATHIYEMSGGKIISETRYGERAAKAANEEHEGKIHRFSPLYLFKGKRFRLASSIGICLLLGVFLTALGHLGSSIYKNNATEEKYSYSFSTRFPNRLVVNGAFDNEAVGAYEDAGDLLGDVFVIASYLDEEGRTYALPSSSIQPILPSNNPTLGEKNQEGCYLLMSETRYSERRVSHAYIEGAIGREISIYDSENYHRKSYPQLASAIFRGVYVLDDSSFFLGSEYSLYVSPSVLSEMRYSLIERLDDEAASFEEPVASLYYSGPSERGGNPLKCGDKILSSLSDSDFFNYPSLYLSSGGEELPPATIYVPTDLEGEEFSFVYRGSVVTSKDVEKYVCYMGWPLKNGEWRVSSATLKRISVKLGLERSVYFSSPEDMRIFEDRASGIAYIHGNERTLLSESSLDIANTIWLAFIALAGLSFSLLASWLLRKIYKARETDFVVLAGRGYSLFYLTVMESVSYAALSIISTIVCFITYLLTMGGLSTLPFIPLFALMGVFALAIPLIPIGKKKFRRI